MSQLGKKHVDVLVSGGGIVGSVFVSKLMKLVNSQRLSIGIIDTKEPPLMQECLDRLSPDVRVYALSPSSISTLQSIDAWNSIATYNSDIHKFKNGRSQPFYNMQVWEGNGPGIVRFDNKDDSKQLELGRIVEDSTVHSSIYDALKMKDYKNIDYIYGKSIQAIERSDGMLSVSIGSNNKEISKVTTKLLIGADGTNSTVRRLSGISTWGWGYGQEAIVCTVMVDKSHSTAWQKYTSTGPIAILPLWDNYSSIVWSTSSVEAKRLKELSPEAFIAELNKIMQTPPATEKWLPPESTYGNTNNSILSKLINKSKTEITALIDTAISVAQLNDPYIKPPVITGMHSIRVGFPLQFLQANTYTKDNIALIGDAAHSIHPQAGQGLNLGIKDADMLAHTIASALENGQNISDQVVLANYGSVRARNNLAMMSVVDSIHRLFNNNSLVGTDYNETQNNPDNLNVLIKTKQLVRTLGLLGVHSTGHALKNNIARIAMGL